MHRVEECVADAAVRERETVCIAQQSLIIVSDCWLFFLSGLDYAGKPEPHAGRVSSGVHRAQGGAPGAAGPDLRGLTQAAGGSPQGSAGGSAHRSVSRQSVSQCVM